jgi:hypothetical protein
VFARITGALSFVAHACAVERPNRPCNYPAVPVKRTFQRSSRAR